jgi:hypothetical protein
MSGWCRRLGAIADTRKLYGREREVDTLLAAFDRVVAQGAAPQVSLASVGLDSATPKGLPHAAMEVIARCAQAGTDGQSEELE